MTSHYVQKRLSSVLCFLSFATVTGCGVAKDQSPTETQAAPNWMISGQPLARSTQVEFGLRVRLKLVAPKTQAAQAQVVIMGTKAKNSAGLSVLEGGLSILIQAQNGKVNAELRRGSELVKGPVDLAVDSEGIIDISVDHHFHNGEGHEVFISNFAEHIDESETLLSETFVPGSFSSRLWGVEAKGFQVLPVNQTGKCRVHH